MNHSKPLALVTGGGVRVGKEICKELALAGYTVVVHANSSIEKARQLALDIAGVAVKSDLTAPNGVNDLFAQLDNIPGKLSVLVNNAAIFEQVDPAAVDRETWQRHFDLNLSAPFWCAQAAHLRFGSQGGSIVNIIDIAALAPEPGYVHYAASKAGLISLTKGLAKAWGPHTRVNAVAPGPVLMPEFYDHSAREKWLSHLPMGDELGPKDVAKTVRFLVDGPRGITGTVITVDGGWTTTV